MNRYCKNSISKATELSGSQTEANDMISVTASTRERNCKLWSMWMANGYIYQRWNGSSLHSRLVIHLNLQCFDQRQSSLERGSLQKPLMVESRWRGCGERCPSHACTVGPQGSKKPGCISPGWVGTWLKATDDANSL